jgi:phosphatidylglycerophosphatase A
LSPAVVIASFFGTGFAPKAPGTVGSLAALLIGAAVLSWAPSLLAWLAALASIGGYYAVRRADIRGDPGWVVIDEVAGQWIAMLSLARPTVAGLLAAFVLFRLLDITKPGPIGWADRQEGAAGIMGDDVIAGGIAAGVLWALQQRFAHILDGNF